ncbi:MAG: SAM-dependent methyltransferase, partial [Methylophilales bacterium 16-45-7]
MQVTTQHNWLNSPLGRYLLAREQAIYDEHVADIFGYNALQIGLLEMDLLQQSRIAKRLHVDIAAGEVRCESEYLPFASSSIDLLCLPHVLEFSQHQHQTLREVERVLVPEGHLILT